MSSFRPQNFVAAMRCAHSGHTIYLWDNHTPRTQIVYQNNLVLAVPSSLIKEKDDGLYFNGVKVHPVMTERWSFRPGKDGNRRLQISVQGKTRTPKSEMEMQHRRPMVGSDGELYESTSHASEQDHRVSEKGLEQIHRYTETDIDARVGAFRLALLELDEVPLNVALDNREHKRITTIALDTAARPIYVVTCLSVNQSLAYFIDTNKKAYRAYSRRQWQAMVKAVFAPPRLLGDKRRYELTGVV